MRSLVPTVHVDVGRRMGEKRESAWTYMVHCMAMYKTTVYLPDDLKAQLERTAAETRRSEADLIREGIRLAIGQHQPPAPRSGIFDSGDPSLAERVDELLKGFGER